MAQEIVTYEKCPQCKGTGTFEYAKGSQGSGVMTCNWTGCGGSGYIAREKTTYDPGLDDILNKCNDNNELLLEIKAIVDAL